MSLDKLHEQETRAARAKEILENELMVEAFVTIEAEYITFWKTTPARDTDARERIWHQLQNLGKLKGHLETVMSGGNLAKRQIEEILIRTKPDWADIR